MNRKMSTAFLTLLLFHFTDSLFAYILFEQPSSNQLSAAVYKPNPARAMELVRSLERITGLELQVSDNYLKVKTLPPVPLMYAAISLEYAVRKAVPPGRRFSTTARELLLNAMRSQEVYRVRENRAAALGRVNSADVIELDFSDYSGIVFRDVPKEAFDIGMIFFHELAHRHLKLLDPPPAEVKQNSFVKGDTVAFVNRIERELGLPERRHYAPVKIRLVRDEPKWGIYFGKQPDRIEMERSFGLR